MKMIHPIKSLILFVLLDISFLVYIFLNYIPNIANESTVTKAFKVIASHSQSFSNRSSSYWLHKTLLPPPHAAARLAEHLEEDNRLLFGSDEWVLNLNVTLYSTKITHNVTLGSLTIEAMTFLERSIEIKAYLLRERLKCFIKCMHYRRAQAPRNIFQTHFKYTKRGPRSLWRVECVLDSREAARLIDATLTSACRIGVAIADTKYLVEHAAGLNTTVDRLLLYQHAEIGHARAAKRKQVAHCVHKVIGLNEPLYQRLVHWIEMQRYIGFTRMRLCFFEIDRRFRHRFAQRYSSDSLVQVKRHHTALDRVCKRQLRWHESSSDRLGRFRLDNCRYLFEKHFDLRYYPTFQHHQMLCTNDCLLQFRDEYQYVTNYDFDELMLPRRHAIEPLVMQTPNNCSNAPDATASQQALQPGEQQERTAVADEAHRYDINAYADKLFGQYGRTNAYIKLDQVVHLSDYRQFLDSLKAFEVSRRVNHSSQSLSSQPTNDKFRYRVGSSMLSFELNTTLDFDYMRSFDNIRAYVQCLNDTFVYKQAVDYQFNNPYATLMKVGKEGKSIFNTDYAESYNAHQTMKRTHGSSFFVLPLSQGVVSHFRKNIVKYINGHQFPFQHIKVDLEYYKFLIDYSNSKRDDNNK